jgi:hypothetical protein
MYYNGSQEGHYNYVAVQGTGDKNSPYYTCPSVAYDTFNKEGVYDDQVLGGGPGEPKLGAYNDLDPYGGVNDPKGWYGPAPLSYVEKPTCSGFPNNAELKAEDSERDGDYDSADRYHRYRQMQYTDNTVGAHQAAAQAEAEAMMMNAEASYDDSMNDWTSFLILVAVGLGLLYLRNTGQVSNQIALIVGASVLLLFFLQKTM